MAQDDPRKKEKSALTLAASSDPNDAEKAEADRDQISVATFTVGGAMFAVGVEYIEGVVDCPRISPLPAPSEGVIGVASVRGRMTIVIDLSSGAGQAPPKRRLILLKGDAQLGLLADRVDAVVALSSKQMRPRPTRRRGLGLGEARGGARKWPARAYFRAGRDRIPVLDVDRLTVASG